MQIECAHCGKVADKAAGAVNRARKSGSPLYCDRFCAGLARRKARKTSAQKKAEKAAYDAKYRAKNRAALKAKKAAYYAANHDREKEREYRQKRMPKHVEYCRRPEYRVKKKAYDHVYRAKKDYGPMWEIQLLTLDIRNAVLERQTDYEIRLAKGTLGKSQKRKRDYDQNHRTSPVGQVPQVGPVVNLERGERR